MIRGRRGGVWLDSLTMMLRMGFLIIVFITLVLLVRSYNVAVIETYETEALVFANAVIYSPDAISYHDPEINRVYPAIIDRTRFKPGIEPRLDEVFSYGDTNTQIAAQMTLRPVGETPITIVYNRDRFDAWYQLASTSYGALGPGGVEKREYAFPVLARDQAGDLTQADLDFIIVMPRS
ncbi:hypothetical protein JXB02_03930 [Candidatus Woesearchaeota archaeon]|nr:hypothetical protein [Candidatus Woesearchaeota archaeon]